MNLADIQVRHEDDCIKNWPQRNGLQAHMDRHELLIEVNRLRDVVAGRQPTAGFCTDDCDHPRILEATDRWNLCTECGQTRQRGLTG